MALSLRARLAPQCSACLKNYAFGSSPAAEVTGLRQQVRGKKKLTNASSTMPVRLLKDVKTFGRRGAIVPVAVGKMRNYWFPRRMAEYVTGPERRTLRLENVVVERDVGFGNTELATSARSDAGALREKDEGNSMSSAELQDSTPLRRKPEVERVTPERSVELVEIFVPLRLDFYRQPIVEEKAAEEPPPPPQKPERAPRGASGAAMDLLAARTPLPEKPKEKFKEPQGIYGSVSTHDVLVAMRAAMANNEEAARVLVTEGEIRFLDVTAEDEGRVKHVGDFIVEISPKGAEKAVRRSVRVIAQETER